MFTRTTAFNKIATLNRRIRVIQGGTSAGKTVAILLFLISAAQTKKTSISIVSESLPHLKRGAMRDFLNIMREHNYYDETEWNRTNYTYYFRNGSYIEFFNADDPAKLRGARRDVLFINEANNISYAAYEQMEVRTRRFVIVDYNPVSEFWVHEEIIPKVDHDFLILTYKDNEALEDTVIRAIESRMDNENWWRVYGLGQVGIFEGLIFPNWSVVEAIPGEAKLLRRGLDFGFTNDPTAIVDIWYADNTYYLDEKLYASGLHNNEIADFIKQQPHPETLVVADNSEPKSISEIKRQGVQRIIPCTKGKDSINWGIDTMQGLNIAVTKASLNILKERRNYMWKLDRDDKSLNIPIDDWNHCMDAIRYAIVDIVGRPKVKAFTKKPSGW